MLPLNRLLLATALLTTACTALAPTKKPSPATAAPKQQGPTWQDIVTRGPQPVDREKRLEAARNEFTRMQAGESRLPVDLHVSTILIALRGMRSDEAKSLWSQVGEARSSAPAAMAPANAGEQEELHSRVFQSILQSANYTLADLSKFDRGAVYNLALDHWIFKNKLVRKTKALSESDIDSKLASLERVIGEYEAKSAPSPRARLVLSYLGAEAARIRPQVIRFHEREAQLVETIDNDRVHSALITKIESLGSKIRREEKSTRIRVSSCRGHVAKSKLCKLNQQQQQEMGKRIDRTKELYRSIMSE